MHSEGLIVKPEPCKCRRVVSPLYCTAASLVRRYACFSMFACKLDFGFGAEYKIHAAEEITLWLKHCLLFQRTRVSQTPVEPMPSSGYP